MIDESCARGIANCPMVCRAQDFLDSILFRGPQSSTKRRLTLVMLVAFIYVLGAGLWLKLFNFGHIAFSVYDWHQELRYGELLQTWMQTGVIPWQIEPAYHATHRFLSIPEIRLSPQILLLRWMSLGRFIVTDLMILYTAGFAGLLLIKQRFQLSLVAFLLLFGFFDFNGHLVAHLAVGHAYAGIFLLPYFFLALLSLLLSNGYSKSYLGIALSMFVIATQGTFSLDIWCLWLLAILLISDRARTKSYLAAILVFMGLAAYRILPGAVAFIGLKPSFGGVSPANREFVGGFPTITSALEALTQIRNQLYQYCWWEFDTFVSLLGLVFLLYFGVYRGLLAKSAGRFAALLPPVTLLAIFSLNVMYGCIAKLPLPLVNSEITTSRFLLVSVLALAAVAAIKFQEWLDITKISVFAKLIIFAGMAEIFCELILHFSEWTVAKLELPCGQPWWAWTAIPKAQIVSIPDPMYQASVVIGCCVSVLTLVICLVLFLRKPSLSPTNT